MQKQYISPKTSKILAEPSLYNETHRIVYSRFYGKKANGQFNLVLQKDKGRGFQYKFWFLSGTYLAQQTFPFQLVHSFQPETGISPNCSATWSCSHQTKSTTKTRYKSMLPGASFSHPKQASMFFVFHLVQRFWRLHAYLFHQTLLFGK